MPFFRTDDELREAFIYYLMVADIDPTRIPSIQNLELRTLEEEPGDQVTYAAGSDEMTGNYVGPH